MLVWLNMDLVGDLLTNKPSDCPSEPHTVRKPLGHTHSESKPLGGEGITAAYVCASSLQSPPY